MYRVAVIQNQSESLRSGYADVARNLSSELKLVDYEFVAFDGGNVADLFEVASLNHLLTFDSVFISTNATSDTTTRVALEANVGALDAFLHAGRGIYFGYQKKLSVSCGSRSPLRTLLPDPYNFSMENRPSSEPDSSAGTISVSPPRSTEPVGGFLVLNSPNPVSEQLIMTHCLENDFKAHVYRSVIQPSNEAAFETVLEDRSYPGDPRRVLVVNRSSVAGERVVVSTVALDWESHRRLLENVVTYITEGVPRVALVAPSNGSDLDFDYIRSTAKLLQVANRTYKALEPLSGGFAQVHDVFVVSARWPQEAVEEYWASISGPRPFAVQPASAFRRLYHLGDRAAGSTSLTRYVNYTAIDVLLNDALLWLEQQFQGGFWAGGFWNSHDVLQMMDALRLDVTAYLPGVLADIEPHLEAGGYDAVMGPSCGLMNLLNRLSDRYGAELAASGFGLERRAAIATWVLENLDGQSEVARQVAARALFGPGGDPVVESLRGAGRGGLLDGLTGIVRTGLNVQPGRISSMSEMDLVRLIQLAHGNQALESTTESAMVELQDRQSDSGLWGSIGRTANIVANLLEIDDDAREVLGRSGWDVTIARAVEAIRGAYSADLSSWGEVVQDTAMGVHALGLYRSRYDVESQELFETVEADVRSSQRSVSTGRSRIDLSELFARELRRESRLRTIEAQLSAGQRAMKQAQLELKRAQRKARLFQVFGGTSFLMLLALTASFAMSQRKALLDVVSSSGSLLGLVAGAIIAVPVTLLLSPRPLPPSENANNPEGVEPDDLV